MEDAIPTPTPLYDKMTLESELQEETEVDAGYYQTIICSLSYTATTTHPDIAFAVSALSQYNSRPFTSHLTAAKRVLLYLKETTNLKLMFSHIPITLLPILRFTGSSFEVDFNGRKLQGGYIFQIYNGPVPWKSYKQSILALSRLHQGIRIHRLPRSHLRSPVAYQATHRHCQETRMSSPCLHLFQ